MKDLKILTKTILFLALFLGTILLTNGQVVHAASPYSIKVNTITDKDKFLTFNVENADSKLYSVIAEINGKKYTNSFYDISNYFYLDHTYPAGTEIKVYFEYKVDGPPYIQTELMDTIIVKDGTPPKLNVDDITVRTANITIESEKNAAIKATYAGKEIAVTNISETTWNIKIPKPQTGKKLVITSTDENGNKTVVSRTSVIPSELDFLRSDDIHYKDKTTKGWIYGAKSTDKVYLVVGSKKYKGTLKKENYTIKVPKVKPPKNVSIRLIDKYGNILESKKLRVYKYDSIKIGMTKTQIKNSFYGAPDDTESSVYTNQKWEQWHYYVGDDLKTILTFLNGKLYSIDKF